ncbi:hypothetical protein PENSPDRAFT_671659 [Peniophora sp. CONT]|nr:hypothetical protein PENSPDRAFT_671659 [Peniophora sp. CONT]
MYWIGPLRLDTRLQQHHELQRLRAVDWILALLPLEPGFRDPSPATSTSARDYSARAEKASALAKNEASFAFEHTSPSRGLVPKASRRPITFQLSRSAEEKVGDVGCFCRDIHTWSRPITPAFTASHPSRYLSAAGRRALVPHLARTASNLIGGASSFCRTDSRKASARSRPDNMWHLPEAEMAVFEADTCIVCAAQL